VVIKAERALNIVWTRGYTVVNDVAVPITVPGHGVKFTVNNDACFLTRLEAEDLAGLLLRAAADA